MISNKNDKGSLHRLFLLKVTIVILACYTLFFGDSSSIANERTSAEEPFPEPPRYRVFNLRHISADQAKEYLDLSGLAVKVQILREDMFSMTGLRPELTKAGQLVKLVDVENKFIIKSISIPADFNDLPANEEMASQIGDILIGSFPEPPAGVGPKAIIDRQEKKLVIIAPIGKFSLIEKIITDSLPPVPESQIDANLPTDTNQPTTPEHRTDVDSNEVKIPDVNQLSKIMDANKIEEIDANELPATDINESDVVDVLGRLVTSLEGTKVPESRELVPLQEQVAIPAEANEPNRPAIEEEEQIIQRPEEPQQPEKTAVAAEQKIPDQNEPQPPDEEQIEQIRSYKPEPVVDSNEQLTIEVPEKLRIVDLLSLAGEYLNINYMYDPAQVQGEVTLKLSGKNRGKIKIKELYPLVEAVLKYRGLVMTRTEDNLVIIAPKAQAKDIDPAIIEAGKGQIRVGDVIVTRIFELSYIDAESAKNLLVGMNLGEDINTSASEAGYLIVTGYAYRMPRIEQLLSLVDVPGPAKEFRFRQLKYTMAATLKDKIKSLTDQLGTVSITVGAAAAQPAAPSPRRRGESTAAYRARLNREARARGAAAAPAARPTAEPESVYLDVDERTNRILMIGLPEQLDTVESLIDTLDVQQQDVRSLRLYEIQNVDAAEVTSKLQELGIISTAPAAGRARSTVRGRTAVSGRTPAERTTPPATATPSGRITAQVAGAAPEQEPLIEEPQVVIIESTNSLLVNATIEQHAQIATIIGFVDAQPEEAAINYVVYPLENQDPEELATVLNQLIEETIERRDPTGKVVSTETTRKTEEDITILADKNTFSIIVYASKKNQQWIESLIHQLDKRRPQVLIDVTLVEVSRNDEFTLDLDLVTKYPTIPLVGSGQTGFVGTVTSSLDRRLWEVSSTAGTGKAFYSDNKVQALLTAMEKKGYGRVLARPKLLVNDNESGVITTKETQTVVSAQSSAVVGATGPGQTSASVVKDLYNAEITLDIKPHISEGQLLRLEISMTRTDIRPKTEKSYSLEAGTGKLSGPNPPDLVTSNVETVITVPDDRTIILGGLEKLSQTKGGTKVPVLGDIPLVGGLFRNTANTDSQSRLYVFVKANILRPSEELTGTSDIELVSQKNREKFEKYESEMQEYEDWPGIKPKPMDPIKILEED